MISPPKNLRLLALLLSACLILAGLGASAARADFGFESTEFAIPNGDGSPDVQAGSHPFEMTNGFALNTVINHVKEQVPDGDPKDIDVTLPAGFIGDPTAVPKCSTKDFHTEPPTSANAFEAADCPADTQVGIARTAIIQFGFHEPVVYSFPVFNLVPPPGVPAAIGFNPLGLEVTLFVELKARPGSDGGYAIVAHTRNISQLLPVDSATVTLWGVPGEAVHDPYRGPCMNQFGESACEEASDAGEDPFFALPTSCTGESLRTVFAGDSWPNPGVFAEAPAFNQDSEGHPLAISGCNQLEFAPTIEALPTTNLADSPSGLDFHLSIPQNEDPKGLATSHLKDATLTLPPGLTVNPSSADGLEGCSAAQIGIGTTQPATCPEASKIGSAEVITPLLSEPVPGQLFLGTPECSPCSEADAAQGKLIPLYIQAYQPQTGVLVKLAGHAVVDPSSGRITTSFKDNPQLPFSDLTLHLKSGARAPLRTPTTCATYASASDLTPWAAPEVPDATPASKFKVKSGAGGGECVTEPGELPLSPSLQAGTLDPQAGSFSPLAVNLNRGEGQQELASLNVDTPPGIAADLRGVPYCPQAALEAAAKRSGRAERQSPSCPAASQIGSVDVGAGAGPAPFHAQGKVYLAGPYKGAPLSLAAITPALAGPFDLGTVVVRNALNVNPETAQIHAVSDPIPTVLDGIPLDIRSVHLAIDRSHFTINPTYCEPMSLYADVFGAFGAASRLTNPFQVGGCSGLGFEPKLSFKLKGSTKRGGNPAFTATLKARAGDANIGRAQVTLPHSAFLDQAHIKTVCTRVQFAAKQCPPGSIYGHARAITPLLDSPLEGPVYLRSSSHELPDLVASLNGQIDVVLDGRIDSVNGGIRNTFEVIPDAPVTKFTLSMQGGKKGLLENSTDLCATTNRATAVLTGQNDTTTVQKPELIAQGCANSQKKHKRHDRRGRITAKHHG